MDNSAQIEYWNGGAGEKWVRDADRLDRMLLPFAEAVMAAAKPQAGETVMDIGCGAGALTLALGAKGVLATGVDVSAPLIDVARRRAAIYAPETRFVMADASQWQPSSKMHLAVSRFGVMFFADPAAAFANIRSGMEPGGRLVFACWRPLAENDWALLPIIAALPLLKEAPPSPAPGAPGPFAFGDADHVRSVLTSSGWSNVRMSPWDGTIQLPGSQPDETAAFMLELGPLSRVIAEQEVDPEQIKAALVAKIQEIADDQGKAHLKAAVWIVEATA